MHCRCFSYTSAVLLLAFGGLMAGCGKEGGSTPDAQVDAFRVSAELDRTKNKLTAAERDSAAKGDAGVLPRTRRRRRRSGWRKRKARSSSAKRKSTRSRN